MDFLSTVSRMSVEWKRFFGGAAANSMNAQFLRFLGTGVYSNPDSPDSRFCAAQIWKRGCLIALLRRSHVEPPMMVCVGVDCRHQHSGPFLFDQDHSMFVNDSERLLPAGEQSVSIACRRRVG